MEQQEQVEQSVGTQETSRQEQVYEGRKVQAENMRLKKQVLLLEKENRCLRRFIGGK